jgi:hypothetical protein
MRHTVQPVDIPELIEAMQLIVRFVEREQRPLSSEDLQTEFSSGKKGKAKVRNIIGTLVKWDLLRQVEFSRYEPTSTCRKLLSLSTSQMEKGLEKIIIKKEPKYLEMLYLVEGSRNTIEDLLKRLGRTFVSTKVFLRWGQFFGEIEKEGKFFVKRPTKGDTSLPHKQLARCAASDLARVGFNVSFEQGFPPIDLIAENQNKQRKIYVECKSSIGEIDKGIGQLVIAERRKNDELWLVVPSSSVLKITYSHFFKILKGLDRIKVDLVLYDLEKFLSGETAFRERIRLIGWKKDKILLDKLIKTNLPQVFDLKAVSDRFSIEGNKAKTILDRLVNRGLLLKENGKYSFRFKKQ